MIRNRKKNWLRVPALAVWLMLSSVFASWCMAQDPFSGTPAKPSFTQSIKQSFSKVGDAFSSKPKTNNLPSDDATLLSSKGKPSAELYLSVAKLCEETNKPAEAEQQYQLALKEYPNHLGAMLAYARFMENQGRFEEAVSFYQTTMKSHPKDASVHNNLALCYARKKKVKEATSALSQAVQLDPRNPLYRNNIAALLVEQNRLAEAYAHLHSVHGDAKANYNLGYLLSKKGETAAAEHHFKQALKIDPTMEPAERWLSYLQNKSQPSQFDQNIKVVRPAASADIAKPQAQMATRIAPPPALQQNPFYAPQSQTAPNNDFPQEPPTPPESSSPKRLPPISVRQPVGTDSSVNASVPSETAPDAPLPPGA